MRKYIFKIIGQLEEMLDTGSYLLVSRTCLLVRQTGRVGRTSPLIRNNRIRSFCGLELGFEGEKHRVPTGTRGFNRGWRLTPVDRKNMAVMQQL